MPVSRRTAAALSEDVTATYVRAEVRLLALIGKHLAAGAEAPDWAEAKLAELQMFRKRAQAIMAEATRDAVDAAGQATTTAYNRGQATGEHDLGKLGVDTSDLQPRQAEHAVEALVRAQAGMLEDLAPRIVRQSADAYRDAVVRASAGTLTGGATRLQDAQTALDELASKGITAFTDARGRRWGLESYVDMATRTTTAQAAIAGHMDRLEQAGISLFVVSNSSRECDRCAPWEGKVLSRGPVNALQTNVLTGETERVDIDGTVQEAMSAGLFHPNCTHSLSGYIHGATKRGDATRDTEGYADQQQQRAMERKVREWKRREAAAVTPEAQRKAQAKVREWQGAIRDHVAAKDLPRKPHRERFDVAPLRPGAPALDQVDLTALDAEALDSQVAELMAAGDFGPRMERLAAELDRRQAVTAVIPEQPGGVAEQAFLDSLFGEASAEDLAAWARYDETMAANADRGHLSGLTVKQQREEYDTWAYSQWLRAEGETRGVLLNREGVAAGIDPARFFDGSTNPATIRKYASSELLEWFGSNPRMSFDEFRAMNGGGGKRAREARDRFQGRTLGEWG